jgi:hypothetical protein
MLAKADAGFDKKALERLERVGGVALMAKVIDQFLEKVPQRMDDACDRGRAGDLRAMGTAVESIAAAAWNVGANEVGEMAGRIQKLATAGAKDMVLPLLCQLDDMLVHVNAWLQKEKNASGQRQG